LDIDVEQALLLDVELEKVMRVLIVDVAEDGVLDFIVGVGKEVGGGGFVRIIPTHGIEFAEDLTNFLVGSDELMLNIKGTDFLLSGPEVMAQH
jgi:hypothetical protein